jgi:hypothetical protein
VTHGIKGSLQATRFPEIPIGIMATSLLNNDYFAHLKFPSSIQERTMMMFSALRMRTE